MRGREIDRVRQLGGRRDRAETHVDDFGAVHDGVHNRALDVEGVRRAVGLERFERHDLRLRRDDVNESGDHRAVAEGARQLRDINLRSSGGINHRHRRRIDRHRRARIEDGNGGRIENLDHRLIEVRPFRRRTREIASEVVAGDERTLQRRMVWIDTSIDDRDDDVIATGKLLRLHQLDHIQRGLIDVRRPHAVSKIRAHRVRQRIEDFDHRLIELRAASNLGNDRGAVDVEMLDIRVRPDRLDQLLRRGIERIALHRVGLLLRDGTHHERDAVNVFVERADHRQAVTAHDGGNAIFRGTEDELLAGCLGVQRHRGLTDPEGEQQQQECQRHAGKRSLIHRLLTTTPPSCRRHDATHRHHARRRPRVETRGN